METDHELSIVTPITDEEILEHFQAGLDFEQHGEWGEAITSFEAAIDLVKQIASGPPYFSPAKIPEQEKEMAVDCWMGILRCRLAMERVSDPEIRMSLIPKTTEEEVQSLVKNIKKYRLKNRMMTWNKLLVTAKELEAQCREADMPESAEIFYRWGQKSLMRIYWELLRHRLRPVRLVRWPRESNFAFRERKKKKAIEQRRAIRHFTGKWLGLGFYSLVTNFRLNLFRPFLALVIIPWFVFAGFYWALINHMMWNGQRLQGIDPWQALGYAISFSIYTFTGAGPGDLTLVASPKMHLLAAAEVAWGYFVTVIIISRFINFLTNLTSSGTGSGKASRAAPPSDNELVEK